VREEVAMDRDEVREVHHLFVSETDVAGAST